MIIAQLLSLFLALSELLAGKVIYHFEDDTVILPCGQLSNETIIWQGPVNYSTYGYGEIINPKLSKSKRLSVLHVNGSLQYDLQIRHFSSEDEGHYKCIRSGLLKGVKDEIFILTIRNGTAKPKNIQSVALTNDIIVMWQAGYVGGLRQSFFIEYRKDVDVRWLIISAGEQYIFVIKGLESDTVYIVRMYSKTDYGDSDRTDEIISTTGKQGIEGTSMLVVIPGIISLLLILSWFGIKAFKNKCNLNGNAKRINTPGESEMTYVRQIAQYEEIDSLYYNPMNDTIVRQAATQCQPSEAIQLDNHRNVDIIPSRIVLYPSTSQDIALNKDNPPTTCQCNLSECSPSSDSYLVPCRKYIDLDNLSKNEIHDNQTDKLSIEEDDFSVESDSSETNAKSVKKYEIILPVNTEEHSYQ